MKVNRMNERVNGWVDEEVSWEGRIVLANTCATRLYTHYALLGMGRGMLCAHRVPTLTTSHTVQGGLLAPPFPPSLCLSVSLSLSASLPLRLSVSLFVCSSDLMMTTTQSNVLKRSALHLVHPRANN